MDEKHLKMESPNRGDENVRKIAALFPNCVTEADDGKGGLKRSVNFELLKQMLSPDVVDGAEHYEFTWVGKKKAIVEANKPIRKTLRPCKEESKNWDTTENLYIEGDNLEVLKLLQESYLGKVKMIYIDPPYNTGNDFIYNDEFVMRNSEYQESIGEVDDVGNRLFKNTETNGRFHSDWCSMIYSRLMLARNLLSDDGVIFISIDDNEVNNMMNLCNEVFGARNFVAIINWRGRGGRQDSKYYAAVHEYILCYGKSKDSFEAGEEIKRNDVYPKFDAEKGRFYKTQLLRKWGSNSRREDRPNLYYHITAPDGTAVYPFYTERDKQRPSNFKKFDGCWRHGASTMKKNIEEGKVEFVKNSDGDWIAYEKIFAPQEGEEKTQKYTTWIEETNDGSKEVKELFGSAVFDYPKGTSLIFRFLKMADVDDGAIVLDFFSGSATTAHAVMQLNAEDGGHRKFIMVQLPEPCDEKSEAFKAGYKNICEIGKERIRRAGEKIMEMRNDELGMRNRVKNGECGMRNAELRGADNSEFNIPNSSLDIGFRVLKVADSNMKDVYYAAGDYTQDLLSGVESNIKDDRTDLDLLFGCLLDWGLTLSCPYSSEKLDGCTVHTYNDGDLVACFDARIPESVITAIAKRKPLRAVFRDAGFASSPEKINVFEIFKLYAPETSVKVI